MASKLLVVKDVAEILGVKEERVYALAREGIIPTVRLGRQYRWSAEKIQEFIDNGGKSFPGGWKREA